MAASVVSLDHSPYNLDEPIDHDLEIRAALKRKKAPGVYGLPVFKMFHNQLVMFTTTLFNKLLKQESYPEIWSSGSIKPVPNIINASLQFVIDIKKQFITDSENM